MSRRTSLSISVRRHFVDEFFYRKAVAIQPESRVIDIGGHKGEKRGNFNIETFTPLVTYVNIDKSRNPDIQASADNIPVEASSFDIALMGELLEHVENPLSVLKEAKRILKPGGKILATVPFMYPLHGDPDDFARYTGPFWQKAAQEAGFSDIEIEMQGSMPAVAALMIQHLFRARGVSWRPIQNSLVRCLMWLDRRTENELLKSWTTGFGLTLTK